MKTKHAFIAAHASGHAIRFMCRVLGSWFHARRRAAPKRAERAARRGRLGSEIREIFEQSKRCYGAPRIHAELKARGLRISKRSVAKLIRPPRGRRRAPITTDSRHCEAAAPERTAFVHREAGGGRRSPPTAATPMRSRPICSTATSKPLRPMRSGSLTSPTSQLTKAGSTSPPSRIWPRWRSSAGRWPSG